MFKWIRAQNHEIWIYTNSYRGRVSLKAWFEECGMPVDAVIDQIIHDQKRSEKDQRCTLEKKLEWFGIDLHFDDLDELAEQVHICKIDSLDSSWTDTVKHCINNYRG